MVVVVVVMDFRGSGYGITTVVINRLLRIKQHYDGISVGNQLVLLGGHL
jgi:hypothetical protein